MNDYLLYQLKNPTNNEIFYIGITTNLKKRMKYHYETSKKAFKANPYKARIIYDLKQHGLKPISNIVFESLSFHEAKELEVLAILALKFHGVNLTNISDGGDIVSEETRKKLSLMRKGKKLSMEIRMAMSKRLKGRLLSEEHKKNISNALKGQKGSGIVSLLLNPPGQEKKHIRHLPIDIGNNIIDGNLILRVIFIAIIH